MSLRVEANLFVLSPEIELGEAQKDLLITKKIRARTHLFSFAAPGTVK
jgi:hypothetical protein